jgi:hypothetical protein
MAKGTTNTDSKLPEFPGLKLHEKRAVMLRAEGKTYDQVTNHINTEYALDYSVKTIQEWFQAGGRLEQAYLEFVGAMASSSLKEARLLIMRSMKSAAATLISGMNNPDPRIAQEAAKSLLNKYIPDKQIALSGAAIEDELPPELDLAAEEILAGGGDGSEQVDNPPESSSDTPNPGT